MRFVWDPRKEKVNLRKHGVSFETCCHVFSDPYALTSFDEEHSEYEDRWVTMGRVPDGNLVVVAHAYRVIEGIETIRIISARKATRAEERMYVLRRG